MKTQLMLSRNKKLQVIILMGLTLWAGRFLLSPQFGLYEDDYSRIPFAIQFSGDEILDQAFSNQSLTEGHGLLLHGPLIILMSFIGWTIGGLHGLYALGFVLVFINAVLFYLLVLRIWEPAFATLAALSYCLFSADTTQAYLTHAFGLQPSLLFLLLAMHAYLAHRKWVAYLLATCVLFIYETPFLLMLVLPLIEMQSPGSKWKGIGDFIRHAAIISGILLGIVLARYVMDEGRVADLQLLSAIKESVLHVIEGPVVSLGTYFLRAWQVINQIDWGTLALVVIGFGIFFLSFWAYQFGQAPFLRKDAPIKIAPDFIEQPEKRAILIHHPWVRTILIGLLLLILAYPFTFTVRAYAISGRDTRVHFAGIVGASILFASLLSLLANGIDRTTKRKISNIIIAGWFALLLGFGLIVQKDYQTSWENQISFWSQLIQVTPDLDKGTVILVDAKGLNETSYIGSNTWNLARILEQIYAFPEAWGIYDIPRVYRLTPDWDQYILGEEGILHINARTTVSPRSYDRAVNPAKVIFLDSVDNQLAREAEHITINGTRLTIKSPVSTHIGEFRHTLIYSLLVSH